MSEPVEATTTRLLGLALQAASLRQQAAAANVVQGGSPAWRPLQVQFESRLEHARQDHAARGLVQAHSLEGAVPQLEAGEPTGVVLDAELARMAGYLVHAQALLQGLGRHLGLLALAAADGRR